MAKHSTPRGEASTKQGIDSLHGRKSDPNHEGKHRAENVTAGSDLPARDGTQKQTGPQRDNA